MKHCKITNLLSEHEFGDLNVSLVPTQRSFFILSFRHSDSKTESHHTRAAPEQGKLLKMANTKSVEMHNQHLDKECDTQEKLETNGSGNKTKEPK